MGAKKQLIHNMDENNIKLNLGCASRLLDGYVNIDQDDIDAVRKRYPNIEFPVDAHIFTFDVFNLPYKDATVSEIIADGFLEHLSFSDEKRIFEEISRVLKPGGKLNFSVPDFEAVVKLWLEAEDNWLDFYRSDKESIEKQHWFGNYSYSTNNRWGYLTAMLYGSQHGEGQYHKNCYTPSKIHALLGKMGFAQIDITRFRWKEDRDPMLRTIAIKG